MFAFSIGLAVGGEQRRALRPGSAQPRTAACDCTLHSEAGALLAGRLPIQQRGMTGTGLRASTSECAVRILNWLRLTFRQLESWLAVTGCALAPSGLARGRGQPAVAASAFVPAACV